MKNKRRFRKRFIFAAVAVLLIAGILSLDLARNVSVAEAKQNVFTQIVPYHASGLKVLEITPTVDDKELGYFFPTNVNDELARNVANVTHGTKFNSEIPGIDELWAAADQKAWDRVQADRNSWANGADWYNEQEFHDRYLAEELNAQTDPYLAAVLRSYGMIKPSGSDLGVGSNSEYPIYDRDRKGSLLGSLWLESFALSMTKQTH